MNADQPTLEQIANQRVALVLGETIIARIVAEAERDILRQQATKPSASTSPNPSQG